MSSRESKKGAAQEREGMGAVVVRSRRKEQETREGDGSLLYLHALTVRIHAADFENNCSG